MSDDFFGLTDASQDFLKNGISPDASHVSVLFESGVSLIWMPHIPRSPQEIADLAYEVFHTACYVMEFNNIRFSDDSSNAYASLIKYITSVIMEVIYPDDRNMSW